jgi:N-formylglutamate deformylase
MCQSTYMDETHPYAYRPDLAGKVIPLVESMVQSALKQTEARQR